MSEVSVVSALRSTTSTAAIFHRQLPEHAHQHADVSLAGQVATHTDDDLGLPSDEELMIQVASTGDSAALSELFRRYHRHIYFYFLRRVRDEATADDLASETFLKVLRSKEKFRVDGAFRPWLYMIARFTLLSFWASCRRRAPVAPEFAQAQLPTRETPCDEQMILDETKDVLQAVVCSLPEPQFSLLHQRYWTGTDVSAIAAGEAVTYEAIRLRLEKVHAMVRSDARIEGLFSESLGHLTPESVA